MGQSTYRSLFYHLNANPYIAFLSENKTMSPGSFTSKEDSNIPFNDNINLIFSLELVSFLQKPIVSLCFIMPVQLLFATTAVFIQIRTLDMLKKENSINNRSMTTQAKLHMIFWPSIVLVNTLSDNIYPLSEVFSSTFCAALSFHVYFCAESIVLYSFYAALLRYLCLLHTNKVNRFGKNKLIGIIYWMFYLHTLLWALFTILTRFNFDYLPLINGCYGNYDRVFLMEDSLMHVAQRHFCGLQSSKG